MASGLEPAAPSPVTPLRASGRGEHWWPVALAIIVVAGLHVALPAKYRGNPPWVGPAVLLALLAALVIGDPGRIDRQKTWLRIITGTLIAFVTVANLFAAAHLVHDILTSSKLFASNATGLLATGGVIWVTNVIAFGLWYWDLDRGGAAARAHHPQASPAFVFPEMLLTGYAPAA
jgi:branched-subunit amino acid transport protein